MAGLREVQRRRLTRVGEARAGDDHPLVPDQHLAELVVPIVVALGHDVDVREIEARTLGT